MVLLICPVCTTTVVFSLLSFICCASICPWCICTSIASAFNSAYFSASTRADIPYFPGTILACLIATSCRRLDICSTLSCLNPKALHTSCILIGLHQPFGKCFLPIHKEKALLRISSRGTGTAIDGPGPPRKHTGCPKFVDDIGLMKLYTMDPLVFPQALYTVVAKDVSTLSTINEFGGVSFPNFSLLYPGRTNFAVGFITVPTTIIKMKDCLRSPRSSRRLHKYIKLK